MKSSAKGQISILVAIIFQVLFVFFAMVINVGVLVHDKINLQNSVDIAAYYGAMKQAEILDAIAHLNYQMRQAWKLLNWRLWVLADAGRNPYLSGQGSGTRPPGMPIESPATWTNMQSFNGPVVCVQNPEWYDEELKSNGNARQTNACTRDAYAQIVPTSLSPAQLSPLFAPIGLLLQKISQMASQKYNANFSGNGVGDYILAARFIASYKAAIAVRRMAIFRLQQLLIQPANGVDRDFLDISGHSVGATVKNTLLRNLTSGNHANVQIDFYNSLQGNPFLVPIEGRLFIKYLDYDFGPNATSINLIARDMFTPPRQTGSNASLVNEIAPAVEQLVASDYYDKGETPSAQLFAGQSPDTFAKDAKTVLGFEKNPWVVAYVRLKVQTKTPLMFAPGSKAVTLTAESIAIPFGGRIGPWYMSQWPQGQPFSSGGTVIDPLLPQRKGMQSEGNKLVDFPPPNYSRYPGDQLGMSSNLARYIEGIVAFGNNWQLFPRWGSTPSSQDDYYYLATDGLTGGIGSTAFLSQDPVVCRHAAQNCSSPVYNAEVAAVAPDLFDAIYYSIDPTFMTDMEAWSGPFFKSTICPEGCDDFGSIYQNGHVTQSLSVEDQVATASTQFQQAFWVVQSPADLLTSWNHESSNVYLPPNGPSVGVGPTGGRSGYSIKFVSPVYFTEAQPWGGAGTQGTPINPPP